MNVKSYLKGIGVGMIVASLILIIAGNMSKMSDEDVINRAKELGMIEASQSIQNSDNVSITDTTKETLDAADSVDIDESNKTGKTLEEDKNSEDSNADIRDIKESSDSSASDKTSDTTQKDNTSETVAENKTTETTDKNSDNDTTATGETVKVEVKSGMSSESVSLAVKNAGLVEDDTEFNKYLCENGYDKRLRVGSFDIPSGSDFETISKYLCGIK